MFEKVDVAEKEAAHKNAESEYERASRTYMTEMLKLAGHGGTPIANAQPVFAANPVFATANFACDDGDDELAFAMPNTRTRPLLHGHMCMHVIPPVTHGRWQRDWRPCAFGNLLCGMVGCGWTWSRCCSAGLSLSPSIQKTMVLCC